MVSLARQEIRLPRPAAVARHGALGAACAATALAVSSLPSSPRVGGDLGAVVVGAGYSVADLLLVAMICGLLAIRGVRGGATWPCSPSGWGCSAPPTSPTRCTCSPPTFAIGPVAERPLDHRESPSSPWPSAGPNDLRPIEPETLQGHPGDPPAGDARRGCRARGLLHRPLARVAVTLAAFTLLLAARADGGELPSGPGAVRPHGARPLTDELTGLGNRRALFKPGEPSPSGRRRPANGWSSSCLDLDNFKLGQRHARSPRAATSSCASSRGGWRATMSAPRPRHAPGRRRVRPAGALAEDGDGRRIAERNHRPLSPAPVRCRRRRDPGPRPAAGGAERDRPASRSPNSCTVPTWRCMRPRRRVPAWRPMTRSSTSRIVPASRPIQRAAVAL